MTPAEVQLGIALINALSTLLSGGGVDAVQAQLSSHIAAGQAELARLAALSKTTTVTTVTTVKEP
jgi:hypothetical protein